MSLSSREIKQQKAMSTDNKISNVKSTVKELIERTAAYQGISDCGTQLCLCKEDNSMLYTQTTIRTYINYTGLYYQKININKTAQISGTHALFSMTYCLSCHLLNLNMEVVEDILPQNDVYF